MRTLLKWILPLLLLALFCPLLHGQESAAGPQKPFTPPCLQGPCGCQESFEKLLNTNTQKFNFNDFLHVCECMIHNKYLNDSLLKFFCVFDDSEIIKRPPFFLYPAFSAAYSQLGEYDSALHYWVLYDSRPYWACTPEQYDGHRIAISLGYAALYQKLGNRDKAIESLLAVVFANDYTHDETALQQLMGLLGQKTQVKQQVDLAIANMYLKRDEDRFAQYYISIMGVEIAAPYVGYPCFRYKKETIALIRASRFYQMISSL